MVCALCLIELSKSREEILDPTVGGRGHARGVYYKGIIAYFGEKFKRLFVLSLFVLGELGDKGQGYERGMFICLRLQQ